MQNREHHLSFCKICKNRVSSIKDGIICGLTNRRADFDYKCENFKIDKFEIGNLKDKFERQIKEQYPTTRLEKFFNDHYFEKVIVDKKGIQNSQKNSQKFKFRESKALDKMILVLMGISLLYLIYDNIKHGNAWDFESANVIGAVVILFVGCVIGFRLLFHNYETKIVIDNNGIDYKGNKILWNNVLDYGVLKHDNDNFYDEEKIIIGTISKGIQIIDISELDVKSHEIISILDDKTFYNNV